MATQTQFAAHTKRPVQSRNRSKSRIKATLVAPLLRASYNVVSKRVGYVRVSTVSQSLEQQTDALVAAGCSVIYGDHGVSGSVRDRDPPMFEPLRRLEIVVPLA